jgi:membrane-associated phospholipid phosphatase
LIGFIISRLLNLFLEHIIFKKYNEKILLTQTNSDSISVNDTPSGHFQSMSYSFLFYILSHKNKYIYIIFLYLFIALCTFYNCLLYKYHTGIDIISGIFFGLLFGYMYYKVYAIIFRNIHYKKLI